MSQHGTLLAPRRRRSNLHHQHGRPGKPGRRSHAVNAVIAKLSLITAVGGVTPSLVLPVQLDLGTNNDGLLSSTFYTGLRQRRMTGHAADELMHELIRSIENRFGVNTMLFFEDMQYRTAMQLLSQYGCAAAPSASSPAAHTWRRRRYRSSAMHYSSHPPACPRVAHACQRVVPARPRLWPTGARGIDLLAPQSRPVRSAQRQTRPSRAHAPRPACRLLPAACMVKACCR